MAQIDIQKLRAFHAKKSLGQNFLHDDNISRKIVTLFNPKPEDVVVEIGPGFGALTGHLLASGCNYTGVEIDQRLIAELYEKFGAAEKFHLLNKDFRKFSMQDVGNANRIRLIGNIPYHITSHIIFTAFELQHQLSDMVLMIQREVADRVVAVPGTKDYGILSVISQSMAKVKQLFVVPATVFQPKPEVESAVVLWDFSDPLQKKPEKVDFFRVFVRTVFNQRRKMLRNTMKNLGDVNAFLEQHDVLLDRRPEALNVEEFISLSERFLPFASAYRKE